jgi:DNA-binding transcriptional ArsR family regulator
VPASAATVLDALGDARRRSILERLLEGPLAVGVLAGQLPISRPAVSQHLRVLKEAELVIEAVTGTRHLYRINPRGFEAVRGYFDRFWTTALDNFAALVVAEAATDNSPDGESGAEREERTDEH